MRYADFRAPGYSVGCAALESANTLVVGANLNGTGMHWAPEHVNLLLALRGMESSGRQAGG